MSSAAGKKKRKTTQVVQPYVVQPRQYGAQTYQVYPQPRVARMGPAMVAAAPGQVLAWPDAKYFDTSFTQTVASAADWTGTEVPCTNYIQSDGTTVGAYTDAALIPSAVGSGYGQVVAQSYHLRKIRVRGHVIGSVSSDAADVPQAAMTRVVLVMDTRPNGAQGQGEEVFTDMGSAKQCNYSFLAMGSGSGGRFRILADKWIINQPAVAGGDNVAANQFTNSIVNEAQTFSFAYTPKQPIHVLIKANSATPTVASLVSHNIFLLAHSNLATQIIDGCARCYFVG